MIGGVATLLYFIVLVLLFLLVKFHQQEVTAAEGGLMINFGNVDEAAPGADMALNDRRYGTRQRRPGYGGAGEFVRPHAGIGIAAS